MARGMGYNLKGHILCGASVALGIIPRKWQGTVRHIDTRHLWAQGLAAQRALVYSNVFRKENLVDLYT